MTAEDAYWHACTGTPIEPELPPIRYHEYTPSCVLRVEFEDGVRIQFEGVELRALRGSADLAALARRRYLAAKGASGDPGAAP